MAEKAVEEEEPKALLFPLLPVADPHLPTTSSANPSLPHWLCNSSFTADISVINDAVSSQLQPQEEEDEDDEEGDPSKPVEPSRAYERLESSESDEDSRRKRQRRKKKGGKQRKRRSSGEKVGDFGGDYGSRKSDVRAWADSETRPAKDYYFDTRGDRDNLVFGGLYRYLCPAVPLSRIFQLSFSFLFVC